MPFLFICPGPSSSVFQWMPSPLYCLEQSNFGVVSEWSRASHWALHPTFPSNQQEGSRWSPPVIVKCVHRNCRRHQTSQMSLGFLVLLCCKRNSCLCIVWISRDRQCLGKRAHMLKPLSLPPKGGCTAASRPSPRDGVRGGGSWKKQPKVIIVCVACLPSMSS